MSPLDWKSLSADYAGYHRTAGNRRCHLVGIPLIVFSLVYWSRLGPMPLVALILPIYFLWSWKLGLGMAVGLGLMAAACPLVPGWAPFAAFVAGWLLQFAGHRFFEGKSPAFTRNALHLLVGPAWILQESLRTLR